jgi:hypothetical protein
MVSYYVKGLILGRCVWNKTDVGSLSLRRAFYDDDRRREKRGDRPVWSGD